MHTDESRWIHPASSATFPQLVRAAATTYGDKLAIRLLGETLPDASATFVELDHASSALARGLVAQSVGKGSRIGFIAGNGPVFAIYLAAIARIGAIAVPISTMIRSDELVRVLRQSDVQGLIVQRHLLGNDYCKRLCDALPELRGPAELRIARVPYLRWIVSTGDALPASIRPIEYLIAAGATVSEEVLREIESEIHTSDQMLEIYTSGSMALPKGVKHTHGAVLFRAHYLRAMADIVSGQEIDAWMPMFWVGGLMKHLVPGWEGGATTVCAERTLSNSRIAMGSVLSDDDLQRLSSQPRPYWGLGMSETLGPYTYGDDFRAPGYPVCSPMDHIAEGYEVRIADEHGGPVGNGEVGEMQVRGYPVTPGLHKVERHELFSPDGYYRTGDQCLVEGNRLHFVGRSGDMIKAAGANVSPAEVEMEMQALEGVHNAYVVGLPDSERGQFVAAAVVARDGVKLDFIDMEAKLRAKLSSYKVPRAFVEISRADVPMLASNKVGRRQIAAMLAARLGRSPPIQ